MRSVLVICAGNDQRFFLTTVLGRSDIHLRMETALHDVLQVIIKSPPDLLVIREYDTEPLGPQLDEFAGCYPSAPFPVALISSAREHPDLPSFVKKILPVGIEVGGFNDAVAELLNLPTRRSARFPIRIGIDLAAPTQSTIANTVNISATGMLIESSKQLTPGKIYQFRFMAVARVADVPPIKVKIVREETGQAAAIGTRKYAVEFVGIPPEKMDKVIEKLLA